MLNYLNSTDNKYSIHIILNLIIKALRGMFYKAFKIKTKGPVLIGQHVVIDGFRKQCNFGKRLKLENNVYLQSISINGITLGDNVTISNGAIIRPSGYYGGLLGYGLIMGNNSSIGAMSYIGCSGKIEIGNNVMIGPRVTMIAENHNFDNTLLPINKQGVEQKGILIKDDVWIGSGVTILDGVTIERGCVIGAGAVVTKSTKENGVYVGVPAKLLRVRK